MCSKRITDEHRLTYNMDMNQNLIIYSCKFHYEDWHLKHGAFFFTQKLHGFGEYYIGG
uniref:type II toxin-antitoxin system YoeB family toxin n=1 Tax=Lachnospira eligens TaxID=39485 RepID=UPI0040271F73